MDSNRFFFCQMWSTMCASSSHFPHVSSDAEGVAASFRSSGPRMVRNEESNRCFVEYVESGVEVGGKSDEIGRSSRHVIIVCVFCVCVLLGTYPQKHHPRQSFTHLLSWKVSKFHLCMIFLQLNTQNIAHVLSLCESAQDVPAQDVPARYKTPMNVVSK